MDRRGVNAVNVVKTMNIVNVAVKDVYGFCGIHGLPDIHGFPC
jgi:hypothetical protein